MPVFHYVKGKVAILAPNLAVVDCAGVGYACRTTNYTISRLNQGEEGTLYTFLHVREDIFDLYGFCTEQELSCFRMLTGISGIGPKVAISILSILSPEQMITAIISGDEKPLTRAQGVGKKTAQRIILELKDKLSRGQLFGIGTEPLPACAVLPQSKESEAAAALTVLGYSPGEIASALNGLELEGLGLEEIVRQALRKMIK